LVESKRSYRCVSLADLEIANLLDRLKTPEIPVIPKTKLFSLAFNSQPLGEISLSGEWYENSLCSQPGSEIPFKINLREAAVKPQLIVVTLLRRESVAGAVRAEVIVDKFNRTDCSYLMQVSHFLTSPSSSPGSFKADSVSVDFCLRFCIGGAVWEQPILLA
jgi:hypothetical protein